MLALVAFIGVIVLLLFLIAKWRWHVFLALLVPLLIFGVLPGVKTNNFIAAFESGFGKTLGSIGVVIVLGSIIAEALRHTGAIQTITRSMVNAVGRRRMPLALTLTGFVLGIAIFSDVAYVILNPLVHSAAQLMDVGVGVMSIGLVGALQLTHAIVPPTPGPLAAAALVGADIGKTIIFGGIACLFGSLASWIWGQYIVGPRIRRRLPSDEYAGADLLEPAVIECCRASGVLCADRRADRVDLGAERVASVSARRAHRCAPLLAYIGWPVAALAVGVWLVVSQHPRARAPQSVDEPVGRGGSARLGDDPRRDRPRRQR